MLAGERPTTAAAIADLERGNESGCGHSRRDRGMIAGNEYDRSGKVIPRKSVPAVMKAVALVMLVAGMTVVLGLSMAQQQSITRGIMSFRDGSFEVIGRVNSLKDHAECWVVLPDDGSLVMELEGLPEDLRIEGLRVVAKVHMDRRQPMGKCVSAIFRIIVEEARNAE